jgi:hypothetical protein
MARHILIIAFILFSYFGISHTRTSSLKVNVFASEVIILGEVLEVNSFWDSVKRNIYTSYKIKVDTVIKGSPESEIQVLVQGGIVENVWQKVSTAVNLNIDERGYFLLNKLKENEEINSDFSSTYYGIKGEENGFIPVEVNATVKKIKINSSRLPEFLKIVKEQLNYNPSSGNNSIPVKSAYASTVITQLSPLILTAGTGEILNIYGFGFGNEQNNSEIWFRYADRENSSFTHPEFDIRLWSDTLIQVVVPSEAATGKVTIKTAGLEFASPEEVTVRYACSNMDSKPVFLIDSDGFGGYTWHLHSDVTLIPQAAEIIENSIGKWICATSMPWRIGSPTTNTAGIDGKCIILLDSLDGTLGRTSAIFEKVFTSGRSYEWVLSEVDIVVDKNQNWSYSRESIQNDQIDFESVILHELAHAKLLSHVNNADDVMHCSISTGIIKNIKDDNIACSDFIVNKSLEFKSRNYSTIDPVEQENLGLPGEISGPVSLCANTIESTYFIPKVNKAAGYIWEINPGNAAVLTPMDTMVHVSWDDKFDGDASLKVYPENYCGSLGSNSNLQITIIPEFDVQEAVTICQGNSYNGWETEGVYLQQLSSGMGCDSIITTYLSVNELIEPTIFLKNDTISCSGTFASYQWYNENGIIPGTCSKEYVVEQDGIYYLEVSDSIGCSIMSEGINITTTSNQFYKEQEITFLIYPNPNSGVFYLQIQENASRIFLVKIFNHLGKELFYKEINKNGGLAKIDFSSYPKGVYLVQVSDHKTVASQKIILK